MTEQMDGIPPNTLQEAGRYKYYAQCKENAGPKRVPPVFLSTQDAHSMSMNCFSRQPKRHCETPESVSDTLHTSNSRAQGYAQFQAACKLLNPALIAPF